MFRILVYTKMKIHSFNSRLEFKFFSENLQIWPWKFTVTNRSYFSFCKFNRFIRANCHPFFKFITRAVARFEIFVNPYMFKIAIVFQMKKNGATFLTYMIYSFIDCVQRFFRELRYFSIQLVDLTFVNSPIFRQNVSQFLSFSEIYQYL